MTDNVDRATSRNDDPFSLPGLELQSAVSSELPPQDDGQVTARIVYSSDYLIEALARHRAQKEGRWAWLVLRAIAILGFAGFAVLVIGQGHYLFGVFLALFTLLLLVGQRFENWRSRRALASSLHLDEELTVSLSDAGYHVWSTLQDTRMQWAMFTKAVYFDDGFLLLQGPGLCYWIPFSALVPGADPEEIESLLRSKLAQHEDRRTKR